MPFFLQVPTISNLSYERLVEQKKREDGKLVFADKDGNIITVKARDL